MAALRLAAFLLLLNAFSATKAFAKTTGSGVSGQSVLHLTQEMLAVAPKRFNGSPGHAAAETFIKDHFAPEAAKGNFVVDGFFANTPAGPQSMHNLIVKFPGKRDGIIVLSSHYETNYNLREMNFVGANDGACTSALLIALGQYLREHPPQGYSVYLVFFDGEESVSGDWTDADSLYGSRHLAAKWSGDGTLAHIKAFLLADMIGWKEMNITRDANSTPWLEDLLAQAAHETGHASYLFRDSEAMQDDHLPFQKRGVPVLDIIDFQYGTPTNREAFHHTELDTLDKLSAQSLQVSADLFLAMIRLVNQTH
ncbi:MAG: M28 family peptidase [Janthinobacterium lividum]